MASPTSIPPLNKQNLVGIWIESVLWGMNCIIFTGALWVIFCKNSRSNQWMLVITSIVLFAFSTAHVAGSLQQMLEAFIYVPSDASPLYSTLYWVNEVNGVAVMKTVLYDTTVWLQDIVLIWRLYVVIVDLAHMGAAYTATALLAMPNANIYGAELGRLGPVGWSLDLAVNISVTIAIAGRLWYMGKKVSIAASARGAHADQNPYLAPIFTIVESGALFAAATLVMLVLYVVGSPLALTGMNISTQLAVLTPLLIIVRVGLGLTHGLPSAYKSFLISTGQMTFSDRLRGGREGASSTILVSTTRDVVSTQNSNADSYALKEFKVSDGFNRSIESHLKIASGESHI